MMLPQSKHPSRASGSPIDTGTVPVPRRDHLHPEIQRLRPSMVPIAHRRPSENPLLRALMPGTPVHGQMRAHGVPSSRVDGRSLTTPERARFEPAFGRDLSAVRVHAGAGAVALAIAEGASAVTVGSDIFLGPGYAPATAAGERLLAHELAHVVQHAGGDMEPGGPADAERAAELAAEGVVRRGRVGFGLRPRVPAGPARQQQSWAQLVAAAQAEADVTRRSAAMVALVRQALPSRTVREAGTSTTATVDPADYSAVPAINFDVRLNSKTKWRSTAVASDNVGYTFSVTSGGTRLAYSILGPMVLDANKGQIGVQMYADHELFHAGHPTPSGVSHDDDEVQAWTDTFVHYFLPTYLQRESWLPLINYYERANAAPRTASLNAIVSFANALSTAPATPRSDRAKFVVWLQRRLGDPATVSKHLMIDLSARLGITASTPSSPAHP